MSGSPPARVLFLCTLCANVCVIFPLVFS
jgi:hypothetical protein